MNIRVEYETRQVRHVAAQCPKCSKWFYANDISDSHISTEVDLYHAQFTCPCCGHVFGYDRYDNGASFNVQEAGYPEVYESCLQKKEVWE